MDRGRCSTINTAASNSKYRAMIHVLLVNLPSFLAGNHFPCPSFTDLETLGILNNWHDSTHGQTQTVHLREPILRAQVSLESFHLFPHLLDIERIHDVSSHQEKLPNPVASCFNPSWPSKTVPQEVLILRHTGHLRNHMYETDQPLLLILVVFLLFIFPFELNSLRKQTV